MKLFRNVFLVLMFSLFLFSVSNASLLNPYGNVNTTNDYKIMNVTCTASKTAYPATFDAGTVLTYNVKAIGGAVNICLTNSTTAAFFTVASNETYYLPKFITGIPINTKLYVWSVTANATAEVLYGYY